MTVRRRRHEPLSSTHWSVETVSSDIDFSDPSGAFAVLVISYRCFTTAVRPSPVTDRMVVCVEIVRNRRKGQDFRDHVRSVFGFSADIDAGKPLASIDRMAISSFAAIAAFIDA